MSKFKDYTDGIDAYEYLGGMRSGGKTLMQKGLLYEKLSKELGCPLDVFINIMLGKITEVVVNYGDAGGYEPLYEELTTAYVSGIIDSYNYPDCLCLETNLCDVPVKDYHKNWWLKGEKDEKM